MKVQVRRGTFETNSSSTHSLSITERKPSLQKFVKGQRIVLTGYQCDDHYTYYGVKTFNSQEEKANLLVNMLFVIIDSESDISLWSIDDYELRYEYLMSQPQFTWLKEVIEEETHGTVSYPNFEELHDKYEFFDVMYDDDRNVSDILDVDFNDELKFKARVKEIIFNDDITISYSVHEN